MAREGAGPVDAHEAAEEIQACHNWSYLTPDHAIGRASGQSHDRIS